jgi:hypothetical protein
MSGGRRQYVKPADVEMDTSETTEGQPNGAIEYIAQNKLIQAHGLAALSVLVSFCIGWALFAQWNKSGWGTSAQQDVYVLKFAQNVTDDTVYPPADWNQFQTYVLVPVVSVPINIFPLLITTISFIYHAACGYWDVERYQQKVAERWSWHKWCYFSISYPLLVVHFLLLTGTPLVTDILFGVGLVFLAIYVHGVYEYWIAEREDKLNWSLPEFLNHGVAFASLTFLAGLFVPIGINSSHFQSWIMPLTVSIVVALFLAHGYLSMGARASWKVLEGENDDIRSVRTDDYIWIETAYVAIDVIVVVIVQWVSATQIAKQQA